MIAIYIDSDLEEYSENVVLTADFVFKTLGYQYRYVRSIDDLKDNDIMLFYSGEDITAQQAEFIAYNKSMIQIPMEDLFWQIGKYGFEKIPKMMRKIKLGSTVIPILSQHPIKQDELASIEESEHCRLVKMNFDIFANVFFHITGYYDFLKYYEDKHHNVTSPFEDYYNQPIVNNILYILDWTLQTLFVNTDYSPSIKKDYWPLGENFAVIISHSVDKLFKWPTKKLLDSFFKDMLVFYRIKYVWRNFFSKMRAIFTNREEYWNFEEIIEIEDRFFLKSTYFWGSDITDEENFDYDIDDEDIVDMIKKLSAKGFDIQLLASKESANNDIFKSQLSRIEKMTKKPLIGLRIQDYKLDIQKTPPLFKHNNIFFDSSYTINSKNGFKNGLGIPFELIYFDMTDKSKGIQVKKTGTLEIPINFRDENLKISKYKNISFERAIKQIEELIKNIKNINGLITFDFSISNFSDINYNFKLFESILRKILKLKPYIATAAELSVWWKKRNAVHITEKEGYSIMYFPEEMKHFSFHIYKYDMTNIRIEGAEFKKDPKDERHYILKNIASNSRVYVIFE